MEEDFQKMVVNQKRILEALQEEQRAYANERADFNKERQKGGRTDGKSRE